MLFFTASDEARVKIFSLPVPPTPQQSSTNPNFDAIFTTPFALTHSHAASGIQTLPSGGVLFSQSSFTSPNDVFIARNVGLSDLAGDLYNHEQVLRITRLTEKELQGKHLSDPDEFWFKGANDRNVQGWVVKPKGWKSGETMKWPVVLYVHGGE